MRLPDPQQPDPSSSFTDVMLQALGMGRPKPETVPTEGFIDVRRRSPMDPWSSLETPRVNRIAPETLRGPLSFDPKVSKASRWGDYAGMKENFVPSGQQPTVPHGEWPENTAFRQEISDMIQKRPAFASEPKQKDPIQEAGEMQRSLDRQIHYLDRERIWNEYGIPNEMKRLATTKMWKKPQRQARTR